MADKAVDEFTPQDLSSFPKRYWITLDMARPMTAHNIKAPGALTSAGWGSTAIIGGFAHAYMDGSADYLPFVPNPNVTKGFMSPYLLTVLGDYLVEYAAELARRKINPLLPSRLSCLYAFGTKSDAITAAKESGRLVSEVKEFELFDHPLTRIARANMRVIDLARRATRDAMTTEKDRDALWHHYWTGGGAVAMELPFAYGSKRKVYEPGVLWEYLIEGRLDLVDTTTSGSSG